MEPVVFGFALAAPLGSANARVERKRNSDEARRIKPQRLSVSAMIFRPFRPFQSTDAAIRTLPETGVQVWVLYGLPYGVNSTDTWNRSA